MDIGFNHERVTAAYGGGGRVFFTEQGVTRVNDGLINAGQNGGCEQLEIVF